MNLDLELAEWRGEWLAEKHVPRLDLGDLVRRRTRRMRLDLAARWMRAAQLAVVAFWLSIDALLGRLPVARYPVRHRRHKSSRIVLAGHLRETRTAHRP